MIAVARTVESSQRSPIDAGNPPRDHRHNRRSRGWVRPAGMPRRAVPNDGERAPGPHADPSLGRARESRLRKWLRGPISRRCLGYVDIEARGHEGLGSSGC